ncbi:MAG: DUF1549 domain-containing protein, partial [Planctomycetota bacterium]
MVRAYSCSLIVMAVVAGCVTLARESAPRMSEADFEKQVTPILQQRCLSCHNPTKSKGSLDLSTRNGLLEGGANGPAIVPGESAKSLLTLVVRGPAPKMPRQGDPLSLAEIETLARWIDAGAPWPKNLSIYGKTAAKAEPWWAIQALVSPALPKVSDTEWCRTPIDRFVLAKLDEHHLKPSPEADRATFIRRVTYDLTGLPPTPEEVESFVKDSSPTAFEKLVDRLLASEAYGERWARIWLDLVHYADTHGFDKDKRRLFAWRYRDWVIRAFNRDLPYRRFIRSQIAGDVLTPGDPDCVIATGFVVAGPWDFVGQVELREGTVDKEKTRTLDRDDMVTNVFATFNSVTVHCARCHDHKFDPIATRDYYRLQAVFAGVERADRTFASPEMAQFRAALEKQRLAAVERRDAIAKAIATPALEKAIADIAELRIQLARLPKIPADKASPTNGYHSQISPTADVVKWVQIDLGQSMPIEMVRLIPARPIDFPDTPGFGFP